MATTFISLLIFLVLSLNGANALPAAMDSIIDSIPSNVSVSTASVVASVPAPLPSETVSLAVYAQTGSEIPQSEHQLVVGQVLKVPQDDAGVVIYKGRTGLNKVALTFDSGWIYEPTEAILQVLAESQVRATFFARGGWVEANPDLVRQIKEGGHEIGNHSYTHDHIPQLPAEEVHWELSSTREALYNVVGETQAYYRPPYGEYNDRDVEIAALEGYRFTVMWTKDSIDWMEPGEDEILKRIGYELDDGGIALMHVGVWQTANILSEVIAALRSRDLEPVPLSEILDWENFPMQEIKVKVGDTLESIAEDYHISLASLKEINGIE